MAKGLALGTCFGIGCSALAGLNAGTAGSSLPDDQHKFQTQTNFSYERLFNFTFRSWFISYMVQLQKQIGKEKFLEMLKEAGSSHYGQRVQANFAKIQDKSVQSLIENFWEPVQKSRFGSSTMTIEIPEKSKKTGTVKMTECLFAKTFRENNAADIGYAAICHADFAVTREFNPKINLSRNKCLMNGDGCCLFEYNLET